MVPILLAVEASQWFWVVCLCWVGSPESKINSVGDWSYEGDKQGLGLSAFLVLHPFSLQDVGPFLQLSDGEIKWKSNHNGLFGLVFMLQFGE